MRALTLNTVQRKLGKLKTASSVIQDEVTSGIINSIINLQKEQGTAQAKKVADLFLRAIRLYEEGVPLTAGLMAVTEFNKDNKNFAKILGFAGICVCSAIPYILIHQDRFERFVEEISEDAKSENRRYTKKSIGNQIKY